MFKLVTVNVNVQIGYCKRECPNWLLSKWMSKLVTVNVNVQTGYCKRECSNW